MRYFLYVDGEPPISLRRWLSIENVELIAASSNDAINILKSRGCAWRFSFSPESDKLAEWIVEADKSGIISIPEDVGYITRDSDIPNIILDEYLKAKGFI